MTKPSGGVLEDLTSRCPSDLVVCVHQSGLTLPFISTISGLRRVQSAHHSPKAADADLRFLRGERFSCYRKPDIEDIWAEATSWRNPSNQVPGRCCGLDAAWALFAWDEPTNGGLHGVSAAHADGNLQKCMRDGFLRAGCGGVEEL
jgi:hypothetical protein